MELKLDEKEVKKILMEWVETQWPQAFNTIRIDAQYGSFRSVEFSHETPEPPTPIKEAA